MIINTISWTPKADFDAVEEDVDQLNKLAEGASQWGGEQCSIQALDDDRHLIIGFTTLEIENDKRWIGIVADYSGNHDESMRIYDGERL